MFGAQVRAHRQRLGMTQEELAARTGVSVRSIYRLEAGHTERPRPGTVGLLADAFGLAGAQRDRFCQSALETSDEGDDAAAHGRPVPTQLPADVAGFAGRSDELGRLTKLLDNVDRPTTVVISAIAGMAGVGKTALAVHWAYQVLDRFPDGQLYVNLRGFDPGGAVATPGEVVRSLLDALDVPAHRVPAGLDAQTALYRSLLADRRMLLLLDNARDVEQVRPLLPGAPGCLVLVTSRDQLIGLIAGAGAVPLPLDLLSPGEARDLLARRVGVDRTATEPAAVDEIIERCARLPLALAVVAARVATQPGLPLAALAAELRHPHDRLDTLATGDAGTDVRSVFSWSYQQLSGPAARLFRLLGVHRGPDLSVPAAASLAGIPPPRVRPMLAELVRAHLVTERVPRRYALHDLLRAYAGELADSGEPEADRQAAARRLLDHYLHTAGHSSMLIQPSREPIALAPPSPGTRPERPADHRQAFAWFEAEHQVLLAAIAFAAEIGADRHAWQLPCAMIPFLHRRGYPQERVTIMGNALAAATRLDDALGQAMSLRYLANAHTHTGDPDQARAHLERCLPLYQRLADRMGEAWAQHNLSLLAEAQGRYADALGHDERALGLFRAIGHEIGEAEMLSSVGWFHALLGDFQRARPFCEQSLALMTKLGGCPSEYNVWDTLGYIELHLGNFAKATDHFESALGLCRDHGNRYTEAVILTHSGDARHAAGELSQALHAWRQAVAIFDDLGHPGAEEVRAKLAGADG